MKTVPALKGLSGARGRGGGEVRTPVCLLIFDNLVLRSERVRNIPERVSEMTPQGHTDAKGHRGRPSLRY